MHAVENLLLNYASVQDNFTMLPQLDMIKCTMYIK